MVIRATCEYVHKHARGSVSTWFPSARGHVSALVPDRAGRLAF